MEPANPFPTPPPGSRKKRWWGDLVFRGVTAVGAAAVLGVLVGILLVLNSGATTAFHHYGFRFLTGTTWDANHDVYGLLPFLFATLVTSAIALALAIPVALGSSIFLTQLAPLFMPGWLRSVLAQIVDLLAAIPSIIYGFWGLVVLVPVMSAQVEPTLFYYLGWTGAFGGPERGLDIFTASVVLSIMVIPTIASISREALAAVPVHQREAALSLGATEWEAARVAVVPYARSGVFGGIILGLGRALGETMAVTLLIGGNISTFPNSLFSPGQTIASLIASSYAENTGPLNYSAIIAAGLVLLLITLLVNILARVLLWRYQRNVGTGRE